jgi:leucyl-tRNA synthetase
MEFHNAISKYQRYKNHSYIYLRKYIETFTLLISPLMPHYAEEIWETIGNAYSIFNQKWPIYDETKLFQNMLSIAVQVNGKFRDTFELSVDATNEEAEKLALALPKIQSVIRNMKIHKIIYIDKKLINIVIQNSDPSNIH